VGYAKWGHFAVNKLDYFFLITFEIKMKEGYTRSRLYLWATQQPPKRPQDIGSIGAK
jgi:hypothetical protein